MYVWRTKDQFEQWFFTATNHPRPWRETLWYADPVPPPNEHRRYRMQLNRRNICPVEMMEIASSRPDIDAVVVFGSIKDFFSDEILGLFQQLMAQERDWEVFLRNLGMAMNKYLEGLPFLKMARYLQLERFDVRMLQALRTFPHLKELDLSRAGLTQNDMYELFSQEDEPLAQKTPHVKLRPPSVEEQEQFHFPPAAQKHLRGLTCVITYIPHEVFQLENLRYLTVVIYDPDHYYSRLNTP